MKYTIGCICAALMQNSSVFGKELVQSFVAPKEKHDAPSIGDSRMKKNRPYSSSYSLTKNTPVYRRLLRAQKFRDFVHHDTNKVKNQEEEEMLLNAEVKKGESNPDATVENIKSHADVGNLLTLEDGNRLQRKELNERYLKDRGEIPHDNNHDETIPKRHLELTGEDCASTCSSRQVVTKNAEDFQDLIYSCFYDGDTSRCPYLNIPVGCWDTSKITDMSKAFYTIYNFNEPINCWNTEGVVNMSEMFAFASEFNQPLSDWNVGSVTSMDEMFYYATNFNEQINDWNLASVTSMNRMFYASSFDQPLDGWNMASVASMDFMFGRMLKFNQQLNDWNVARVTTMEGMFYYNEGFNNPLTDWNVASADNMKYAFKYAYEFNQQLNDWNVGSVTNMQDMFYTASKFNQCLSTWASKTLPDVKLERLFRNSSCPNKKPDASIGPWCQGEEEGCMAPMDSPKGSCVNTEIKMIPNEVDGTEMWCGGLLNQLFAPPQETEKLKTACNRRIKSTDPSASGGMVLVSEECPTFCNFDTCCPVDEQFQFLMDDGRVKRCGGLLNVLVADKTVEGKAALAEACAAEHEAVSGGTAVVEDICTGLCRKGCEVIDCVNKRPDQFLLIPDDEDSNNMLSCDEFLKDMSTVERKIVCKEKIHTFNVKKNKTLKKQSPKKTCPLYCSNRCKKQLALSNEPSQPSKQPSDIMLESGEPSDIMLESGEPSDIKLESREPSDIMLESGEPSDIKLESGEPSEGPIEGLSLSVAPSAKPFETPSKEPDMIPSAGPSKAPELAYLMAQISTTTTDDANELAVEINNEAIVVVNGNSTTAPSVDRRFMNGDCKISTTAVEILCEAYLLCGKTQTNETCFAVETIVQAPVGGGGCDVNLGVEFLGAAFRNPPNPNVTCFADIVLMLATEYPSSQPSIVQSSSPTLLASN